MKKLLLLLAFAAIPAWAGDAAPVSETGLNINLDCATKNRSFQVARLENGQSRKGAAKSAEGEGAAADAPEGCPAGCQMMACPPPSGPVRCCNTKTYQPC